MTNTSILTSVADCDTALADVSQMKSSLEIRMVALQFQIEDFSEAAASVPLELQAAQTQLNAYNNIFGQLPVGKRKTKVEMLLNDLDTKVRGLQIKSERYNAEALLEKSLAYAYCQVEIAKLGEIITELQTRKSQLASNTAA